MYNATISNESTIFGNNIILSATAYIFFPSTNITFMCDLILFLWFYLNF